MMRTCRTGGFMCQHTGTWDLCSECYSRAWRVRAAKQWGVGAVAASRPSPPVWQARSKPVGIACPLCAKKCRGQDGLRAHVDGKHGGAVNAIASKVVRPLAAAKSTQSAKDPIPKGAPPAAQVSQLPPRNFSCPRCSKKLLWGWASHHQCLRPFSSRPAPNKDTPKAKTRHGGPKQRPASSRGSAATASAHLDARASYLQCPSCGNRLKLKNAERHASRCAALGTQPKALPTVLVSKAPPATPPPASRETASFAPPSPTADSSKAHPESGPGPLAIRVQAVTKAKRPKGRPRPPESRGGAPVVWQFTSTNADSEQSYSERLRRARPSPPNCRKCRQCSAPAIPGEDCCYQHNPG